jgi:hypothetical protein
MTNDAKLGMLVGVLGVIVAAVLFTNSQPPQAPQAQPNAPEPTAPTVATAAPAPEVRKESAPLASTPVVRTRKDIDAQPASRPTGTDEEP